MSKSRKAVARRVARAPADSGGLKAVTWDFGPHYQPKFNYAKEVGDGMNSSVLVALLFWLMRTFPEAPISIERREEEQWRQDYDHAMAKLLRTPNPYYGGRVLWQATILDYVFGNAYWLKVRNGYDKVVEVWWVPSALIAPVWDEARWPGEFIHHYKYTVNGQAKEIAPRDVVHFRFGMSSTNQRVGVSPMQSMLRDIYVDDQASTFTAAILRNLGIIGIVFSPATGAPPIPPGKTKDFKDTAQKEFTGEKRGSAAVFSQPIEAKVLSYNLQGFDVGPIRDIAEERLSATLGIPAAIVGFGTGLQQTKVGATMKELKASAWDQCIMPAQAVLAEELDRSLLPEFQANPSLFRTKFDTSEVRALREDAKEMADRLGSLASDGIITLAEARKPLGFDVKPEHDVYYRPSNAVAVKTPGEKVEPPKPDTPPAPADKTPDGGDNAAPTA